MILSTELKLNEIYFDKETAELIKIKAITQDEIIFEFIADGMLDRWSCKDIDMFVADLTPLDKLIIPQSNYDLEIPIKVLNEDAVVPTYGTDGSVGFDFYAPYSVGIEPKGDVTVPLGIAMAVPKGYELEMRGRSGLAFKHNVDVFNGTIDSDYRGEIMVKLFNNGNGRYMVSKGDRIAQGILKKVPRAKFVIVDDLDDTARSTGGFGHTGK